jgi:hypothetical protein
VNDIFTTATTIVTLSFEETKIKLLLLRLEKAP